MLEPFDQRHDAEKSADAIAARVRELCEKEVEEASVATFGGPPVDGLGTSFTRTLPPCSITILELSAK